MISYKCNVNTSNFKSDNTYHVKHIRKYNNHDCVYPRTIAIQFTTYSYQKCKIKISIPSLFIFSSLQLAM